MRSHAKAATAGSTKSQARRLALPFAVLAAFVALMAVAFPASAAKTRLFEETFGSAAQPSFTAAQGIAVDQSSGDVLVMDPGTRLTDPGTIKRFNRDGTPANFAALGSNVIDGQGSGDETSHGGLGFGIPQRSQIAVDNSGSATDGNIYVTQSSPNVIDVFSDEGEYLGQLSESSGGPFSEACGVAVDPSGAVYVGDFGGGIHKFVPAANPPVNADYTATFSSVSVPCALAAGVGPSAGFLFATQFAGAVSKIDSSTGALEYVVDEGNHVTVSVDPGSGNVLAASGSSINEFDASGASATSVSSFAPASSPRGVAANGSSGEVYISRLGSTNLEVFGSVVTLPEVTTDGASSIGETSATLNGAVNPDGVELTECSFEYGKTTSYGQSASCAQSPAAIGSGTSPVPVSADVSGLDLGAAYHFRLVAKNPDGTASGADEDFKLISPPAIVKQWAQSVAFTEADLRAKINPEGFAATFHVEYGTTNSYGQSSAEKPVGDDKADHTVGAFLGGLQPGTTYHYRFVSTNSIGTGEGADHTFTTYEHLTPDGSCPNQALRVGSSATLPDCRAYEIVSPVDKNGGEIARAATSGPGAGFFQAASSGEKLAYSSPTSFGNQVSSQHSNQYIATRGAQGWSSDGINPPMTNMTVEFLPFSPYTLHRQYWGFSKDLSSGWFLNDNTTPLTPDGIVGFANLYRRDNESDSFEAMTANPPLPLLFQEDGGFADRALNLEFKGASADSSVSAFSATAALTPDAYVGINSQAYATSGSQTHLVSVLPDGTPSTLNSFIGQHNQTEGYYDMVDRAVSADGSRIVWSATPGGSAGGAGKIYVRENPLQPQSALGVSGECTEPDKACTIPVSESVSPEPSKFWTASSDGSKILFTTKLSSQGGYAPDGYLYEFDVETETATPIADDVIGVAGGSEDLSYVYFTSKKALDAGAVAGEPNLYLDHDGEISLVAALSSEDSFKQLFPSPDFAPNPAAHSPLGRYSRITPDGRHIVFMSSESLTGYDNTDAVGASPKSHNGDADFEVFLYDAAGQDLTCVSCNPSGARPVGGPLEIPFSPSSFHTFNYNNEGQFEVWTAAWIPTWENEFHGSRVLSDDGDRLFFNSFDALVPEDTNGAQDVYEWEAQGAGTCEKTEGCISLISTGQSPEKSEFIDASPDGDDVFIRTESSIDPTDPGLYDIYDARVGGGYPVPSPEPPCLGDACQGIPTAPNDPTPASASFRGADSPPAQKQRRRCASRKRHAGKAKGQAKPSKQKKAKRCRRAKRGAGR